MSQIAPSPITNSIAETRDVLQSGLPAGLDLGDPFDDGLPIGAAFQAIDRRGGAVGRRCLVRWLPLTSQDEQEWLPDFQKRCKDLAESGLPELTSLAPLEIGELELPGLDRGLYIVERPVASTLADQILSHKKLPEGLVDALSRELARTLAALHRLGLVHGAIGPRQIRLSSTALDSTTHAWLGGVVTGHLQHATRGRLVHPEHATYQLGLPSGVAVHSKPADVHQFLLTMAEARLGTAAFAKCGKLSAMAQKLTAPAWLRRGIFQAALKGKHWPDGDRLWREATRSPSSRLLIEIGTAAGLLLAVVVVSLFWRKATADVADGEVKVAVAASENLRLQAELSQSRQRASDLQQAKDSWESRLAALGAENEALKTRGSPPPQGALLSAQEFWTRHPASEPHAPEQLRALDDFKALPEQHRQDVERWNRQWSDLRDAMQVLQLDLKQDVARYGRAPWIAEAVDHVVRRLWQAIVGSEAAIEKVPDRIKELKRDNTVRTRLEELHKRAKNNPKVRESQARWPDNREIMTAIKKLQREPWNDQAQQALANLDRQLDKAHRVWLSASRATSWAQVREQVKDAGELSENADIKDRLLKQLQFLEQTDNWTLELTGGALAPGHGHYRVLYFDQPGDTHYRAIGGGRYIEETWSGATRSALDPKPFQFVWKPGQPIRFVLYTERTAWRSGARPWVLDQTIAGPVALWKLLIEQDGLAQEGPGKAWIRLDCPALQDCPDFKQQFPKPKPNPKPDK